MDRSGPRILVAGEGSSHRHQLTEHLRQIGDPVSEASNAQEALQLVSGEKTDLVVLALNGASGVDLCKQIKERVKLPVILISDGFTCSAARAEGLKAGADACLPQPVDGSELLAQVSCLLRVRQ